MISIIIPVYNVSVYLDQCVGSILDQSYSNWECILVDDGSTDGSGCICDKWARFDSRIKAIHQLNSGVSAARNSGLDLCSGDYICFVDSDDWVNPNYLSDMLGKYSTDNYDIVVSGISRKYDSGEQEVLLPIEDDVSIVGEHTLQFVELNRRNLLYGPTAILYRSHIIDKYRIRFPVTLSYGEDLLFNYSYLNYVNRIGCIPKSNYYYRISEGQSLSTKYRDNRFDNDYRLWKILLFFYKKHGMWNDISKAFLYQSLWGIIYDGIFGKRSPSLRYYKDVLAISEIKELKGWESLFSSADWIKRGILHRNAILFFIVSKLGNK